jgi:flagellar basal-body rod protein FlgB
MNIDVIPALAAKALDGLWTRQAATAQNVANAGAENYLPVRVSFEDELRQAWQSANGTGDPGAVTRLVPRVTEDASIGSGTVRIDHEIATASETSARYALLTGMIQRMGQFDDMATKG